MAQHIDHSTKKTQPVHRAFFDRRVALLGGTTTWGDVRTALGLLAEPEQLVQGPAVGLYEAAFARQVGRKYGFSFSHGRVGLYCLLQALGIGTGDEVLLQVPTHIVVPNAVRYVGARPTYADCVPSTWNLDLDAAERAITPRTKALVLQHTFGFPADLALVLQLCKRYDLELIEDCVHALGSTYDGNPVGTFGRAAFFSTEETKTISTTMGGMVVTDDPALASRLAELQAACAWPARSLAARYVLKLALYQLATQPHLHRYSRSFYEALGRRNPLPGPTTAEEVRGRRPPAYTQRLSNGQAVLGLAQLSRLASNLAHRRATTRLYERALIEHGFEPLPATPRANPALVRYPLWVPDRAAAVTAAAPRAVLGTWFTSVLEEAVSPAHGWYADGSCPRAESAARHLINFPTHPRVTPGDVAAIVQAVARVAAPGRPHHQAAAAPTTVASNRTNGPITGMVAPA